jgi:hypothetical protein
VAIDENGNIINGTSMSDRNLTNVYGVSTCDFGTSTPYTANGCLSNGHIWTATASYDGTNLSLSVSDPAKGTTDVIYSNLAVDISSLPGTNTAFVGFTAGTGAGYENQDILNWQFANDTSLASSTPEPASFVLLASALGALWVVRSVFKRRAQA